jgi:hypothetical protein
MFYTGGFDCCLRLVDAGFDLIVMLVDSGIRICSSKEEELDVMKG